MKLRAFLLTTIFLGGIHGALAQDGVSDADQEACTPDVFRLCQDYVPNEGQIVQCLQAKAKQLSPACHKVFFPAATPAPRAKRISTMRSRRHAELTEAAR